MYIYMYIYICIYIQYIHVYDHIYIYMGTHVRMYTHTPNQLTEGRENVPYHRFQASLLDSCRRSLQCKGVSWEHFCHL